MAWGLQIDTDQQHQALPAGASDMTTFHPTFLYESVWNLLGFVALILLYRRFDSSRACLPGPMWPTTGWAGSGVESLRVDEAAKSTQLFIEDLTGMSWRLNQWVALLIFLVAVIALIWLFSRRPRTEAALAEELHIYTADSQQRSPDALPEGDAAADDTESDDTESADPGPDDTESEGSQPESGSVNSPQQ